MIAEAALATAGPDSCLVGRPTTDVAHVYVGPLTPSGFVPRRSRPVCRARTRRLAVLPERQTSLVCDASTRRVCARCSACLARRRAGQAEPPCTTRAEFSLRYAGLTRRDLWAQAVMAETLEEINAVAHLSLVVLGHHACQQPLPVSHEEHHAGSLTELIGRRREHLAGFPNRHRSDALQALIETGYAQAKAERKAAWQDREDRIRRLGFINATT